MGEQFHEGLFVHQPDVLLELYCSTTAYLEGERIELHSWTRLQIKIWLHQDTGNSELYLWEFFAQKTASSNSSILGHKVIWNKEKKTFWNNPFADMRNCHVRSHAEEPSYNPIFAFCWLAELWWLMMSEELLKRIIAF